MKTRKTRTDGTQAEMLLALIDQVTELGIGEVLCFLAEEATKYSVDKSGEGIRLEALFPDGTFISTILDDAGYIVSTVIH